jgi:hypothetical protein
MHRTRPRLQLLLVALLAVVSLLALVVARPAFGADPWNRGLDIALIAAWVVAFAASAWLLIATAICVVALGLDRPSVARRLAPALPSHLRRLVEVAIAGSFIAYPALTALPAHAAGPALVPTVVVADVPVLRAPATPEPAARPARPPVASGRVVVRAGDNLWAIARTSLARISGRTPTEREVARYWLTVIAANRSTLRSGDPSLIFPGEIVTLPPPTAVS